MKKFVEFVSDKMTMIATQESINWICCNRCHMWLHNKCANVEEELPTDYIPVLVLNTTYAISEIIFKAEVIMLEIFLNLLTCVKCLYSYHKKSSN